ncbi:MAG: hypothetical protein KME64_17365 [Scytonematopsis contorta HA4267-MV1]|jgi:hypothetical protein|nr:hypothetical protein [Scytonematopsis contorta HA4267-MV1]
MYQQSENSQQPNLTPMDLLCDENWLRQAADFEDEVGGNIGVGLGWDAPLEELTLNPEQYVRLTTLRISLNREIRLLLNDWNLGTITSDVTQTVRSCLLAKFKQPTPLIRERLLNVLQLDELFGEEFISNREVLRELITVMLTPSDWETIATVVADSVKMQIMGYVSSKIILNKCL